MEWFSIGIKGERDYIIYIFQIMREPPVKTLLFFFCSALEAKVILGHKHQHTREAEYSN